MTPQEALMYVGRYAPCAHEETTPAGFSQTKCRECGRLWARELPPPLEAHEKFMQALDVLSAVVNPPPKMDLGERLLERGGVMMNEGEALALGRRATRCNRWKWAPGMLTFTGYRVSDDDAETNAPTPFADDVPDLGDSATLGCLLALVRDAWPTAPATTARFFYYSPERGSYSNWACTYWRPDDGPSKGAWIQAHGETEIEALVAALEAAGVRDP